MVFPVDGTTSPPKSHKRTNQHPSTEKIRKLTKKKKKKTKRRKA